MLKPLRLLLLLVGLCAVLLALSPDNSLPAENFLPQLNQAIAKAEQTFASVHNYTGVVHLRERHGGKIKGTEKAWGAYQKKPFKLYYRWLADGIYDGLQISHVLARDDSGHFMAVETGMRGLIGVRRWSFDSTFVKVLYPHHFKISNYHLGFLISHVKEVIQLAIKKNKIHVQIDGSSTTIIPGQRLTIYRIDFSADPADGILYRRCVLGFSETSSLPFSVETYNFEDQLHASYRIMEFVPNTQIDEGIFVLKQAKNTPGHLRLALDN